MSRRLLILDGYNLMLRDADPANASLADAREAFVRRVDSLRTPEEDVVVVFDGRAGRSSGGPAEGVRVVFARAPRTADDVIVKRVERAPRGSVEVLTRDRELRHRVKSAGGRVGDVDAFLARDRNRKRTSAPKGRARGGKPAPPRGAELDDWERLFGERED